jgi:hypothetical protein
VNFLVSAATIGLLQLLSGDVTRYKVKYTPSIYIYNATNSLFIYEINTTNYSYLCGSGLML